MNKFENILMEVCNDDLQTYEKIRIEVFGLLQDPTLFDDCELGVSYSGDNISHRMRKDLEILETNDYYLVSKFLEKIGFRPIKFDSFEHYQTQYFTK